MRPTLRLTNHAIERFAERIEVVPMSDSALLSEVLRCLSTAKAKHFKRAGDRTYMIPTDRCLFVCSGDAVVTVLKRGG
jgi:hypothetical protein